MPQRLNQYLASVGLADSRRKADAIISAGKVQINGKVTTELATTVEPSDVVTVGGKLGKQKNDIYIAYNKPRGQVCSHRKQGSTPTIFSSLPKSFSGLKIAGRLDKDSRGLVLLSSDGDFINDQIHPSKNKKKIYVVKVNKLVSDGQLKILNEGVVLADGKSNLTARRIKANLLRIEMTEGKNRQIRRTFEALDRKVVDLERVAIGQLKMNWPEGKCIFINPDKLQ